MSSENKPALSNVEGLIPELRFTEFENEGEWVKTKLGDSATFINGKAYKQEELLESGKYRVLRVGNFFTNNNWYYSDLELEENKYCDDGDLLYAWSASFGPRVWKGEKVIYHYHIWKVLPDTSISKHFLFVLLDNETERMKTQNANGFALLHITKGTIENWECSIPKSKAEQQKIASCLSSLDEVIEAHSQKLELLKDHKKGVMQNLFPQEGETVPKYRFKEFVNDGEWEIKELNKLGFLINGLTYSPEDVRDKGLLVLRSSNIQDGLIDLKDCVYVREDINGANLTEPKDILVCVRNGSKNLIGKNAIIPEGIPFAAHGAFMTVFRANNPEFVFQLFKTDYYVNQVKADLGATINSINGKNFIKYEFPVPKNPKEQQKIASCLSSLDAFITAQAEKIAQLKMHKKGLMQGLFPKIQD
jgi:type I restriction enzyme S subunit